MIDAWLYYYPSIVQELRNIQWPIVAVFGVFAAMFLIHAFMTDPRRLERAMARTLERRKVADVLSASLQDACHRKEITPEQWHKYNKKVAKWFELPDMLPKQEIDPYRVKQLIRHRLKEMGVNISEGLNKVQKMKRRKPNQDRLVASIKRKTT